MVSNNLLTVHVRVNDADTGQPTPVRIRITDSAGVYYPPLGRLPENDLRPLFATFEGNTRSGGKAYAYIDGTCSVPLPPGTLHVEVHKGPEYAPLIEETPLGQGKMSLRLEVRRWADWSREGWYSGSVGPHQLTPHGALFEAACEDVAVVNLLIWQQEGVDEYRSEWVSVPNLLAFSGQRPALSAAGHLVAVNTLNTHLALDTLALLNCHRIVYPLLVGNPRLTSLHWRAPLGNWTLSDWCDQCHRKQGLVAWTEMGSVWSLETFRSGYALVQLLLGQIDAVRPDLGCPEDWYALLNAGLRAPLLGSRVRSSVDVSLGSLRTYAHLSPGEEFNYQNWIEAVRAGRTFLTEGPLLRLTANEVEPGSVLDLAAPATVRVQAAAQSVTPFDRLEVLVGGKVVATSPAHDIPPSATVESEIPFAQSGWLAARCWQDGPGRPRAVAHTSPLSVHVGGHTLQPDVVVLAALAAQLDEMLYWVTEMAAAEDDRQRQRHIAVFQQARAALERLRTPK
ncbi:MAG: CehA/McbA family metallohydrolase [Gemmataceae bacterium]|nr:CehA/McbA family metallohydrolase [Gemmataceae bacterium]